MKILTMYLPQYHKVKENDEWWGEGFTDWVTTKEAKPLFEGHYEPHVPMNNYYYDLTQRESFIYQQKLMERYGIDGQCIYHYWFKDGRKILEKPAECLLKWKDIKIPFCFSWANQTWARSWANISNANTWCEAKEETINEDNEGGVLLEQNYGGEKEWEEHYYYLNKFFKDERYIKYKNRPVFLVYQAREIAVLREMRECWNKLARKEGFDGVYFIGTNATDDCTDGILYPAPKYGISVEECEYLSNGLCVGKYSNVNERLISFALAQNKGGVGAFVGYDDTPRRGLKGLVIKDGTPESFKKYLTKILAINYVKNQPFTFINAWNEWGEGMHLEPDERFGEDFLEAVLQAKKEYKSIVDEVLKENCSDGNDTQLINKCDKYEQYWRLFRKWIELYQSNKSISKILIDMGVKEIVIYGLGMIGKLLINDIESDKLVRIAFGVDQKDTNNEFTFSSFVPSKAPRYDGTVVVATITDFEIIKKTMENLGASKVISIKEILYSE